MFKYILGFLIFFFFLHLETFADVKFYINDTKKIAQSYCPVQENKPTISKRPILPIHGSIRVTDRNTDGVLDGEDIQLTIDLAEERFIRNGGIHRVVLAEKIWAYVLTSTLTIPSWVLLDGRDQTLLIHRDVILNDMVRFTSWSTHAWVYKTKLNANQNIRNQGNLLWSWIINIPEDSSFIFLYDNILISDRVENRDSVGNNDVVAWIYIGDYVSKVYVDSNIFTHVPTGINILWKWANNIRVTHNTFANWRLRAIYVRGTLDPIHSLTYAHNRITPPKYGTVRQPIAFHAWIVPWEVSGHTYNVKIYDNYIRGDDVPHVVEIDLETGKRITTSTNGTADMISLHRVRDFSITRNCILNGGELWMAISQGSYNGEVRLNYIDGADTSGIWLGSNAGTSVENIKIISNYIRNPWRNRDQHTANWAYSGIVFIRAINVEYWNNVIEETRKYYTTEWNPFSMFYGISIWQNSVNELNEISPNIFKLQEWTIEKWVSFNK